MKKSKCFKMAALLLVAVLVVCQLPMAAMAADVGISIQNMIAAQIANPGAAVSDANAKVDYQFLHGSFDGKSLAPFTTNSGDYLFEGSGEPSNAVWAWQWRCDNGKDTVLKITAKENMYFNGVIQGSGQFEAGWAENTYYRFVQENAAGDRREIKRLEVKSTAYSAEDSTFTTHLAAGESLYVVYSGGYLATASYCPWFTVNTETYDATKNPFYVAPGTDPDPNPDPNPDPGQDVDIGLGIQGMITTEIANAGALVEDAGAKVNYQFLHGSFDGKSLAPFTTNSGDYLFEGSGDPSNAVWAWQWRCDNGKDTVLKITARENIFFKSEIQEGGQFHAGWAIGTTYRFVQENAAGERKVVKTIEVKDVAQSVEDSTVMTHLAAGESLYIVYSGQGLMTADFCPWFTINAGKYDAQSNPFYQAPEQGGSDDTGDGLVSVMFAMTAAACAMAVLMLNKKRFSL